MTAGPCDWLHQSWAGVLDTRPMCERLCHVYLMLTDRHSKVVHVWSQALLVTIVNETVRLGATDKTSDASSMQMTQSNQLQQQPKLSKPLPACTPW